MRVLFCHDGPLRKDENNTYYGTAHNDETFSRYYKIANNLAALIRVVDIPKDIAKNKYSKITVSPFEVIPCPNITSLKGFFFKNAAKDIIEQEIVKSDYIVARLPSLIGFYAVDYAKKHNKPYLIEVVACPWEASWNHSFKGKIVAPYMYFATKKRVKDASFVVYVTNRFLQNRYPCIGESIGCSDVSLPETDDKVLEKRLAKIDNMSADKPIIIGTVAAVSVRYKGQQYIIKALGKLKKQGINNFEYHLVGTGDQSYLRKIARTYDVLDKIRFIGSLRHEEVFDWLESIDLYAQPSRTEGMPRALIEAMSMGLPCFGTNVGGIPELLNKEFVFNNNKNNIDEICAILKKFDKETMSNQVRINYQTARLYDKEIIEQRRQNFFYLFKNKR
jgi:glycosyltransferase involved in cell wall biosynthesis